MPLDLKAWRASHDLSLTDAAAVLGVRRTAYLHIESRRHATTKQVQQHVALFDAYAKKGGKAAPIIKTGLDYAKGLEPSARRAR